MNRTKHARRKYDNSNALDMLTQHEELDAERFEQMNSKLGRVEKAIYGLYIAIALFVFLIDHPQIIHNLTATAEASEK